MTARQDKAQTASEARSARRAPRTQNPDALLADKREATVVRREPTESERANDDSYRPDSITHLNLPGGGWVDFMDPDDLTNADRKMLRKTLDKGQGGGESTNLLFDRAAQLLIEDWSIVHRGAQLDISIPSQHPGSWDRIPARIAQVIEGHLEPILEVIKASDGDPKAGRGTGA